MSTATITRLLGGRPARRSTAAEADVHRDESAWPAAPVVVLAAANAAIATALLLLCLSLF